MVQISACDSLVDWDNPLFGSHELDTTDKKEGTASIKAMGRDTFPNFSDEEYNPAGTWDWSTYEYIVLWFKAEQRDDIKFRIWSGATEDDDYIEWAAKLKNQVAAPYVWYRVKLYLNDYDASSGTINLAAVDALKATAYQTIPNMAFWLDDVRAELYDPVKVKIGADYVSDDVLELNIWGDDLKVGRWELLLKNTDNKHGGRFHTNEVAEIEINSVSMMKGYLDDVFPHLSDRGVYTNQLTAKGRDYGRDLARLMYSGVFTGTRGDDLIDAILAAKGSEITFDSPGAGGYVTMERGRTPLIDWLQDVATRTNMNYSAYVRQDKALRLFPVGDGAEVSGVALKLIAAALDNNILHLLKGEEIGFSIVNDVLLSAGPLNDHYTDGNHEAFNVSAGVYPPESCNDPVYYLDGTSSIKFGCLADNDFMSIWLDFSSTLYNYNHFDFSIPEECYFLIKPVCHKAGSIWVNARPWLEDSAGCRIEFKRTGVIPFLSVKGKTDDLSEGVGDENWHKIVFTVGDTDIKNVRTNNKWGKIAGSLPFDWKNVVKIGININCPGSWGAIDLYLDSLTIGAIEVISQASDAVSIDAYGKSEWFDQRNDIKSQIELDAARADELEKRKDPLKNIQIIAKGQTGILYAGQSVTVQAPSHGIATATKYRIVSYHHQVRKDSIKHGCNFITTLDLISDDLSPATQVINPRRYMLNKDPVGAALEILALTNRRLKTAKLTSRKGFGDTLPIDKIFYSGSGTAFPEDPEDGFTFTLTADIASTHLAGDYQYDESATSWIRQPALFRRDTNPTYGQVEGDTNENTTDGKTYQWDGDSWEFIGTSDISKLDGQAALNQLIDGIFTGTDGLAKFTDNFWTGAGGLGKFVDDFFSWDKITGSITGFWGAVSDRTAWLWSDITKTVGEICTTLGSWTNMVTELGNLAWTQITKTAGDICDTLVSWAGMVTELGSVAWANISGTVAAFWGAITDRASWAWGDISGTFAAWKTAITDTISWIYADISGTFAQFKTSISDAISWAYTEISDTFANFKTSISDTISWIYTEIGGTFAQFKASVSDAISWTWAEVTKSAAQVMVTISSWANIIAQVGNLAWANLTKTATNIMTTIASWANILSQVGGLSVAQIATALTSWATLTNISALGELVWATITKTGAQVMTTISDWATIITQVGSLAWTNLTKTASNIMTTIASWANILTQVGGLTSLQVTGVLTSWATVTHVDALGNLAWIYVTKTAANVMDTIASWTNIIAKVGNLAWANLTKTASNIMGTISNWTNIIAQVGNLPWVNLTKTAANICGTLGNWATMITYLGNIAYGMLSDTFAAWKATITDTISWGWAEVTKTAGNIMTTIASWANIIAQVGNLAWANLTKTASNIMATIASWANILTQVGGLTSLQITGVLTSWAQVTHVDGLGNLAWTYVTKTAANIMDTIASWTNIIAKVGSLPWANLTKTTANILTTIGSWTNIVGSFGDLAWSYVSHTASNILNTLGAISAAAIGTMLTSWTLMTNILGLGKIGPSHLQADFIIGDIEIKTGAGVQWAAGGDPGMIITDLGLRGKGAAGALMAEILASNGKITAGGGTVILDDLGVTIKGQALKLRSADASKLGVFYLGAAGDLQIGGDPAADITKFADATIQFATAVTLRPLLGGALAKLGTPSYPFRYFTPITVIGSRPAAAVGVVGLHWITRAGTGNKSLYWVCIQNDANGYEWVQIGVST